MKKNHKQLIIIIIIASVFRLILMKWRFAIGFDEPHYLQLGANAALSGWQNLFHPYWPPMFPLLIALFSYLNNDIELVGRLISIITGTAVIIPVYILAKELYDKLSALLAAFILAIFPSIAFSATNVLAESTYTLFSISGVTLGWFAIKQRSFVKGILAGAFWGMSYLTKPEGLGYLFIFIVLGVTVQIYHWLRNKNLAVVKIVSVTTVVSMLIALPYIIYLKQATHEWTISGKYLVNRFDMNAINRLSPDNKQLPLDMAYHLGTFYEYDVNMYAGSDGHARDLGSLAKRIAENVYKILRFTIPGVITGPLIFLMALGLFANRWTWENVQFNLYLLSFIAFFWLLVVPFFHINERYFTPLLPICFVWIGRGVVILYRRLRNIFLKLPFKDSKHSCSIYAKTLVVLLIFSLSFLPELGKVVGRSSLSREFWSDAAELKDAGQWLKKNTNFTPVLMSYNKSVDFYTGQYDIRKTATFSHNSVERILKYAQNRKVNYLIVDERYQEEFPNLDGLLLKQDVPNELKLVYEQVSESGLHVVIYELKTKG